MNMKDPRKELQEIKDRLPRPMVTGGKDIDWSWARERWVRPFFKHLNVALAFADGDIKKLTDYDLELYMWFLVEVKLRDGDQGFERARHDRKRPPMDEEVGSTHGIFKPRPGSPVWIDAKPNAEGYIDRNNPTVPPVWPVAAPPAPAAPTASPATETPAVESKVDPAPSDAPAALQDSDAEQVRVRPRKSEYGIFEGSLLSRMLGDLP